MVSDQARSRLEEYVDGKEFSVEDAESEFEEAYEKVEERVMEELTQSEMIELAIAQMNSSRIREERVGFSGEEMELEILAVGQSGIIDNWGDDNDTVVYCYGFIYGPLGEDGGMKAGKAVFVNRASDGVDVRDAKFKFHALNTLEAVYEVNPSRDLQNTYRCFSSDRTELVETELDNLPANRSEKLEVLRSAIPETNLASIEQNLTAFDPESGYTYDFGADIKRIRGTVVDYYIPDDHSWGRYTIMDDSVTEDDLDASNLVGEDQNVPGLTVWADPDTHMEFGNESIIECYGTIEQGDNGNIVMNLAGVIPVVPMDMDEEERADQGAKATEESI